MEHKKIGFYDYTVILTYCGMLLAFIGILLCLNGEFKPAVLCLMVSGVCDMFDGTVAATRKRTIQEKRFGIQIDSLSDLVSFGVFPGVFMYLFAERRIEAGIVAALYVLAGLIRLAYYNVLAEERLQKDTKEREKFLGVPITTIAIILPIFYVLFFLEIVQSVIPLEVLFALTAVGFITPIEIKKPGKAWKIGILVACAAGILILALINKH